ncbi:MAG: thiol peroxidase [bacterium]|nr:thiol peroxidase [bacterium]MDE0669602.1 thiol peroxidase [bacterium]MXZ31575.1 thiol peroxidase [Acidimicrobiia bacterium]MYB24562.1 thiol peroxidase [Acidimicrobiia bacterium]MYE68068.1 thiol peroxidase [Acidimicrobiia bacterium]
MAEIEDGEDIICTCGDLPAVGAPAPDFKLIGANMEPMSRGVFAGQRLVLNIFPSIDTETCAQSVRVFNEFVIGFYATTVLCVSADLPYAAKRFCGEEGIENVYTASTFRSPEFAEDYGVRMMNGPMEGLCARAVVVIDEDGRVVHRELVSPLHAEPDYGAALSAL